jgi:hypothetical protein
VFTSLSSASDAALADVLAVIHAGVGVLPAARSRRGCRATGRGSPCSSCGQVRSSDDADLRGIGTDAVERRGCAQEQATR